MNGGTYSNGFGGPAPTMADIARASGEMARLVRPAPPAVVVSRDVADALADAAPPSGVRPRFDASAVRVRVSDLLPPGTCIEDPKP